LPTGPYLVLITLIAIGVLLALILVVRLHAFLALFITSMGSASPRACRRSNY
jgi:H+/gluconate symporter-like permease